MVVDGDDTARAAVAITVVVVCTATITLVEEDIVPVTTEEEEEDTAVDDTATLAAMEDTVVAVVCTARISTEEDIVRTDKPVVSTIDRHSARDMTFDAINTARGTFSLRRVLRAAGTSSSVVKEKFSRKSDPQAKGVFLYVSIQSFLHKKITLILLLWLSCLKLL